MFTIIALWCPYNAGILLGTILILSEVDDIGDCIVQKARQMVRKIGHLVNLIGMIQDQKRQNDVHGYLFVSVRCLLSPVYLLFDRIE